MMFKLGQRTALAALGLSPNTYVRLLKTLEGPAGEYLTRIPVQAGMGAIGGLGTGLIMGGEHPGEQSAWGGLMGAGTGLAVAGAPTLRKALTNALSRKALALAFKRAR